MLIQRFDDHAWSRKLPELTTNLAMDQAQRLSNMHSMQRSWLSYVIIISFYCIYITFNKYAYFISLHTKCFTRFYNLVILITDCSTVTLFRSQFSSRASVTWLNIDCFTITPNTNGVSGICDVSSNSIKYSIISSWY